MNGEHKTLCNQFIYTFCITTCILFYPFSYFRKIVRDKNLFIMNRQTQMMLNSQLMKMNQLKKISSNHLFQLQGKIYLNQVFNKAKG